MIELSAALRIVERRTALFIVAVLFGGATFLPAQQPPSVDAKQLVRSMIDNELDGSHQAHGHWMYRQERKDGDKSTVSEVVETKTGDIRLLLTVNGEALTPDQRQKENERLEQLVNDPEKQRKTKQDQQDDDRKAVEMFKMLPEAFLYRYSSRRGSLVKLTFSPNPDFRPPSREATVFHSMEGTMLVNAVKKRLVELDGHLAQDVEFGGGLLGHLEKGGHFVVKRSELAPGQWEMTELVVEMQGKALIFKSINLREKNVMSDFRHVPEDLNPAEAKALLKKSDVTEVADKLAATGKSSRAVR